MSTLATGQFSSLYGGIEDLVVGYTVILATGETIELTASPRAAMGPDVRQVFLGEEGTLVVITSVTLKVFRVPECRILQAFTMPNIHDELGFLREHTLLGLRPFLVCFYDADEASHAEADLTFAQPRRSSGASWCRDGLRKSDFPLSTAVFLRSPTDNRVVWSTPSLESDVVYIGRTDTDYTGDLDDVRPDEHDIAYLLAVANHTIAGVHSRPTPWWDPGPGCAHSLPPLRA